MCFRSCTEKNQECLWKWPENRKTFQEIDTEIFYLVSELPNLKLETFFFKFNVIDSKSNIWHLSSPYNPQYSCIWAS